MTKHYDCYSDEEYKQKNCGYKKPKKCPPNIAGTWTRFQTEVLDGGSIFSPDVSTLTFNLTQNGRFVSSDVSAFGRITLGVWQYNPISGWTLYCVRNGTDNTTWILTPTKIKKNRVISIDSIEYEAGTNPAIPSQVAEVSYSTWTRISNGNCFC